jgi:hypothetical protein
LRKSRNGETAVTQATTTGHAAPIDIGRTLLKK